MFDSPLLTSLVYIILIFGVFLAMGASALIAFGRGSWVLAATLAAWMVFAVLVFFMVTT